MSKTEARAGRFQSKCPAGLHFRVDRCRCDWPVQETTSSLGLKCKKCWSFSSTYNESNIFFTVKRLESICFLPKSIQTLFLT